VVPVPADPLTTRVVDWNRAGIDVGNVTAVAELGGTTTVLAETGATMLSGSILIATDGTVTGWKSAAVIPAADGNGTWVAGIDAQGKVLRLRSGSFFEGVSDLYGLETDAVLGVAALGGAAVAFALDAELAVTDGMTVTRYDVETYGDIAGGKGRAAGVSAGKVHVFEAATAQEIVHDLPGAEQVVFDGAGKLVVRTADAIYLEDGSGALALRYTATGGPVGGLAASDVRVWFMEGTELGALNPEGVLRTTGAGLAEGARLLGSPSGDVWVIEGGALKRLEAETGESKDRAIWEEDVQPIYLESCTPCHQPGGSAGADLSTYGAWVARRDRIKVKVVDEKSMPPTGIPFTEAERTAITKWVATP
jgi:hypothetical protein